jgi:hypothetical protein
MVSLGDGTVTPDTAFLLFTPGPPARVEIEILTPPDQRIAGQPIDAVVRLYNEDGQLVHGTLCYRADTGVIYNDQLGTGGRPDPLITVDSVNSNLNSTAPRPSELMNALKAASIRSRLLFTTHQTACIACRCL